MTFHRPNTEKIIKEDIDRIKAYEKTFGVTMPYVDDKGNVQGIPDPFPRKVQGIVRSGYRITALGRKAKADNIPVMNPILGRNCLLYTS